MACRQFRCHAGRDRTELFRFITKNGACKIMPLSIFVSCSDSRIATFLLFCVSVFAVGGWDVHSGCGRSGQRAVAGCIPRLGGEPTHDASLSVDLATVVFLRARRSEVALLELTAKCSILIKAQKEDTRARKVGSILQ